MPPARSTNTSCARADPGRGRAAIRPTRRFRGARSETPTPPEPPTLLFTPLCLRLGFGDLVGQRTQLFLIEHGGIHHPDQNFIHRTVAEPVDDALDCFRGHAA